MKLLRIFGGIFDRAIGFQPAKPTPQAGSPCHVACLRINVLCATALILIASLLSISSATPVSASDSNASDSKSNRGSMIVIVGAAGEAKYGEQFSSWTDHMQSVAKAQSLRVATIGQSKGDSKSDREMLKQILADESKQVGPLWIVMFGHGTFDGKTAKFNLRGSDFSANELKDWLADMTRPTAIVNCASASAPFINELSAKNRIVISATKSGYEMNATRFGEHFATAISDVSADLDKDNQVSLLEAYLFASARTTEFYGSEGRLATEHSLIDDNSDGRGTSADFFRGVRVAKQANDSNLLPDGPLAHQWHLVPSEYEQTLSAEFREKRNAIELEIEQLRVRKASMKEDEFYARLEELMLRLARHYEEVNVD